MQDIETTFAGYTLQEVVGRDAVSTTYRATVPSRNGGANTGLRPVTIQVSDPLTDTSRDRRHAAAFHRKVAAAAHIDHPAVPMVLDAGTLGDRVFAVTAWQSSIALDELIGKRWRLAPDEAIALLRPLAAGLDAAHAAGVVHGALGVRTIRVGPGGADGHRNAFATGFGTDELLALRLESKDHRDDHDLLDDVLYVAPEQLRGDQVEATADQYALACTLYHCVTGAPPFARETRSGLFGAHLFARPALDAALTTTAGAPLRDAIAVGLAKRPHDRHGSCAALVQAAHRRPVVDLSEPTPPAAVATPGDGAVDADPVGLTGTDHSGPGVTAAVGGAAALLASPRSALRRRSTVSALAVLAGLLGILLLVSVLRDDVALTTSGDDAAAAGNGDGKPPADAVTADGPEDAQEVPQALTLAAAVQWDSAVDDATVVSVAAAGDVMVATTEGGIYTLDGKSGSALAPREIAVQGTPASVVTDNAIVYDDAGLHARSLDDGRPLWSRTDDLAPDEALTFVPGGPLYGMGPGRIVPELAALDPATGEEQWHFHGEDIHVKQRASVAAAEDIVTILQNGSLFAIDPAGELGPSGEDRVEIEEELWRADVERPWRSSLTLLDAAVVYATKDGSVCSHARFDGAEQWCRRLGDVAGTEPAMLADDAAVVVCARSRVVALEPSSGAMRWSVTMDGPISAAAREADTIVVADRAGDIRALDVASGGQRWELADLGAVTSMSADGAAIYAGTDDGRVIRIDPDAR